MLKISDYVAITAGFFGILLFYLIFSGNLIIDMGAEGRLPVIEREELVSKAEPEAAQYIVLCGDEAKEGMTDQIIKMLVQLKKEYIVRRTVEELNDLQKETARVFIVTTGSLSRADEKGELIRMAGEEGKFVFFTCLTGEDPEYEKKLGVREGREETEIDGMMVFEGIFTQGMVYYEDLPMTVRDISLDASCTKMIQERSKDNKEQRFLIPLLWKKQCGDGRIYSCTGPFFEDESGIGIFTGVLSDMEDVFAYPVVNSSAVLLDYYPDFEHVDQEMIYQLYSRDPVMFIRDVIWPSMDKIRHEDGVIISGRTYMQERDEDFQDILRQIRRSGGIVMEEDEGSILPVVNTGHMQSDEKRYRMESMASGEGIATLCLDMREVLGSENWTEEYEWAAYLLELSKGMHDMYGNNQFLEEIDWLEAQERFKRYEKIYPVFEITEDCLTITAEGFVDVWYCMVRTKDQLEDAQGVDVQKVGEDAWLLTVSRQQVQVPVVLEDGKG